MREDDIVKIRVMKGTTEAVMQKWISIINNLLNMLTNIIINLLHNIR